MKLTQAPWRRISVACAVLFAIATAALVASRVLAPAGTPDAAPAHALAPGAEATSPAAFESTSLWQKRWWIEKTARLLRGGDGLGPDDDIHALLKMSEEDIARRFMSDPRFGDAVLDFNMYFLGFKADDLKSDGVYKRNAFDFANAVASAQALLSGGDYFKLFDFEGDFFMPPLRTWAHEDPPAPEDEGLSPAEMRKKVVGEAQATFAQVLAFASTRTPPSRRDLCKRVKDLVVRRNAIVNKVYRAFEDAEIFIITRGQALSSPMTILELAADEECGGPSKDPQAEVKYLIDAVKTASAQFTRAFTEILNFEPATYQPQSVIDFKRFDLSAFPNAGKWLAFGFEQSVALQNSSTNFNRKRSAYVLKRFFCDDLTPVGFEDPQEHVGGEHGSTTSCYACHYKLDPMAGFFRGLGWQFNDYARESDIIFDDLAEMPSRKYESTWRMRRSPTRKWNVGYVRSPRWEGQNSYGETLADLSKIIRSAPEAKRCLMKRLFEYMTAENQTLDGAYLDHLTRTFEAEAATNSSEAMKNAIVRVLHSQTYRKHNPDPDQCYDRGADARAGKGPPCRVAFILQKNCSQCHGAAYDGDAGLDLGAWVLAPDGRSQTFPHLDDDMQQMPAQDTMSKIMERISSTNPKTRMPKNKIMSSQERQELYLWAQQELARILKGNGQ